MFDTIQNKQREQLPHLQLCVKLCQYQIKRQRHFHLEQPQGSSLIKQDVMIPILKHVMLASFDMCSFGLRIPGAQKYLKKGSVVLTTSRQFHELLHDHKCPGGHTHQRIEGSISLNGVSTKLTHFCATYCQGFAKAIAKFLCHRTHTMCLPSEALAIDLDDENEPPAKRFKFLANPHKRRKPNEPLDLETPRTSDDASGSNRHPPDTAIVGSEASAVPEQTGVQSPAGESQPWQLVMQLAQSAAPRVGNMRCDADSEIFSQVCQLVPQIQVESIFICRGTERFQVPIHAPASHGCPIRYTVCLHRHTNQIHDLGPENWHNMTRARRIRNCIPSKMTITVFGTEKVSEPAISEVPEKHLHVSHPNRDDEKPVPEDPNVSAVRVRSADQLPLSVTQRTPNAVCEGWAPPPIALHGPKFRLLNETEKNELIKLHKNLGHPDPEKLSQHLRLQGADPKIVDAAREFVCDACVESSSFRHQRPAQLHEPREFNDTVGIDGFFLVRTRRVSGNGVSLH